MNQDPWEINNLEKLLISQHEEYHQLGLEYSKYIETDELFWSLYFYHRQFVLTMIPEECRQPGTKVIDIGGGRGRICTLLSDLGLDCVNADYLFLRTTIRNPAGEPLIPLLKSYLEKKRVEIVARDVYADGIPFPDNNFDLVIFTEMIEHLPNSPKPLLVEIHRILKKGGYLILSTPNAVSLGKRLKVLRGRSIHSDPIEHFYNMGEYTRGTVYRGHNREYTREEINFMLKQENFSVIRMRTYNTCPQNFSTAIGRRFDNLKKGVGHLDLKDLKKSSKMLILFSVQKFIPILANFIFVLAQK